MCMTGLCWFRLLQPRLVTGSTELDGWPTYRNTVLESFCIIYPCGNISKHLSQSHDAIKQENANDLRNIGLTLYKASISRKSIAQTLSTLRFDERGDHVEELNFMDWLVEVFPSGIEKEHLYIVSMKPGTCCTPFDCCDLSHSSITTGLTKRPTT